MAAGTDTFRVADGKAPTGSVGPPRAPITAALLIGDDTVPGADPDDYRRNGVIMGREGASHG